MKRALSRSFWEFFRHLVCPGHPAQRAGSGRMLISHYARGVFGDWRDHEGCSLATLQGDYLVNRWAQRALINVMTFCTAWAREHLLISRVRRINSCCDI
jgi:hypothetical protein